MINLDQKLWLRFITNKFNSLAFNSSPSLVSNLNFCWVNKMDGGGFRISNPFRSSHPSPSLLHQSSASLPNFSVTHQSAAAGIYGSAREIFCLRWKIFWAGAHVMRLHSVRAQVGGLARVRLTDRPVPPDRLNSRMTDRHIFIAASGCSGTISQNSHTPT